MPNLKPENSIAALLKEADRIISDLPVDEQPNAVNAVTSPELLRYFFSPNGPETLRARFAHRVEECNKIGLSALELGLAYDAKADPNTKGKAKEKLKEAAKNKETGAHYALALLNWRENKGNDDHNKSSEGIKLLKRETKISGANDKTELLLGNNYTQLDAHEKAEPHYKKAVSLSPDPDSTRSYIIGLLAISTPGKTQQGLEILEPLAKKGHAEAIRALLDLFEELGDQKKLCEYLEVGARYGYTSFYVHLGRKLYESGDTKKAIEAYKRACCAGHVEVCAELTVSILKAGSLQDLKDATGFCEQSMNAKQEAGYFGMYMILTTQKKGKKANQLVLKAINDGIEVVPTHVALMAFMEENQFAEAIEYSLPKVATEPKLHFIIGILYAALKQPQDSMSHFEHGYRKTGQIDKLTEIRNLYKNNKTEEGFRRARKIGHDALRSIGIDYNSVLSIIDEYERKIKGEPSPLN